MGRNCIRRQVRKLPQVTGFRPLKGQACGSARLTMTLDEYEAIRLLDDEGFNQAEAARQMGISRPTLTRIYGSARRTFARFLVSGGMLFIAGGEVAMPGSGWRCGGCGQTGSSAEAAGSSCPRCGGNGLQAWSEDGTRDKFETTKQIQENIMPYSDGTGPQGAGRPGRGLGPCRSGRRLRQAGENPQPTRRHRQRGAWSPGDPTAPTYEFTPEELGKRKAQLEEELNWLQARISELEEQDENSHPGN